jgi:uncharacterized repeat protein (TIGR03803 family)
MNILSRHFMSFGSFLTPNIGRYPTGRRLLGLICAASLLQLALPVQAAGRQWLRGHVPAAVGHLKALEPLPATNRLELVIGLPVRNPVALSELLQRIYDPTQPEFHHYLTPAEFAARFGPSQQDYDAVIAFAKARGLRVTGTHPNRTLLDVSGEVADIEKACHVKLHAYKHPTEGRNFYAPDTEPSLDLGVPVLMVSGLDNYWLPRPAGLRFQPLGKAPDAISGVKASGPRGFLMGRDFRAAYVPGVALDGAGEAVGIFALDGYYMNDVLAYQNLTGLPHIPITNVLVNGFSGQPGSANAEIALDIDMASCMAPGLSKVIVYEAAPGSSTYALLNYMANDTNRLGQVAARQLTSSWIWWTVSVAAENQIFQQFAAQGQSFFQASGDNGAIRGADCVGQPIAENPYITIVGGTTLTTSSPAGDWVSEKVWSWFPGITAASGGGFGTNYAMPDYQRVIDMTSNGGSTTVRNTPDVACVADEIWLIAENGEQNHGGGTSAASPMWAGFAALVNQQAAVKGQPAIGFINPALYAIGKSSKYASAFHDTATGNNTNACFGPSRFLASSGYDLCTGWGTPNGSNLISALLAPPAPLRIAPATGLTFTGPAGGPFRPATGSFVLTNDSNAPLSWSVANSPAWLKVAPTGGLITNGGPAVTVTQSITAVAGSLPVGSYVATLNFASVNPTNLSDLLGQSRLVALDIVAPPVITAQPGNQSVLEGMTANLSVSVANSASLSYQWQYDNGHSVTNLFDGGNVSGASSSALVIANARLADAGAYSVIVSNAAGALASSQAFLAVFPWRPTITAQPTNHTVLAGQPVTFAVGVAGTQPLSYRWQRNGTLMSDGGNISGSASSALTINSPSLADAATYSVTITNGDGLAISTGAVLSVTSITAPNTSLGTVYSFTGGADGANPNALVRSANGSFYGTAQNGGTNSSGTVFRLAPGGAVLPLYSFTGGGDGATPFAALAQGPDGDLYGTAYQGGTSDNGTVFRITPNGVMFTLASFDIGNGDLPYAGLTFASDGNFYGTTYQGGAGGRGTAFRITTNGVLTTLYSFRNGADGGHVAAGLLQGSDGAFYGATYKGGAYGDGVVFRLTAGGALTEVVSFNQTNGALPLAELVQDPAGVFYGTASSGGACNSGEVFRATTDGMLPNPYSFTGGSDGSYPAAALLLGSDGNFYGTTAYGGDYGYGTVFRMAPNGVPTTLVAFDGYAGANPQAALVEDTDGSLMGTTQNGGASDAGVIFRLSFSGPLQLTGPPASKSVFVGEDVVFSVAVTGSQPFSYQWQKNGSDFSGATQRVLKLTGVTTNDAGTYSVSVGSPNGATNAAALLTVTSSPPVLTLAPASLATNACAFVSFNVRAIGNQPLSYQWRKNGVPLSDTCHLVGSAANTLSISNVTEADAGTYVVSVANGAGSISATATLAFVSQTMPCTTMNTRYWFGGGNDGGRPTGLIWGTNGNLFATTRRGGTYGLGAVVTLDTNGVETPLASFAGANGASPCAPPVQGADGRFYGTTFEGGAYGKGTVFAMTTAGMLSSLYSFAGAGEGANPAAGLVQGADGSFYGTTTNGGSSNYGTVFRITASGTFSNLHSFSGVDGKFPAGALVQGCDGSFYGVTAQGGANDRGAVYRITPGGACKTVYSFIGSSADGYSPIGALALGSDCNLYGVNQYYPIGSSVAYGTVFKLTPAGVLTKLHIFADFGITDGAYPLAGLMQSSDGNLYGTTSYTNTRTPPGFSGYGMAFRVSPDGSTFTPLTYFDGCNRGAYPAAPLVEDTTGNLYGTTSSGGPCQTSQGTFFSLGVGCAAQITAQPVSQAVVAGTSVFLNVAVSGARPFSYQWKRNGTDLSGATNRTLVLTNVSLADAGTYFVSLSNSLNSVTSATARLTVVYPPVFLSALRTNCSLALTYSTIPGQRYRLQGNTNLAGTNWIGIGASVLPTSNSVTAFDNPCTNAQRFYRILLTPQIQ